MAYFYVLDEKLDILVCDDDPIQREFAGVYLSSPSAEVIAVSCGEDAIANIRQRNFDILLLDIDMPGMSGFDVLGAVRSDPELAQLPIIVITGREDMESIDKAYALGATSFVAKPVNWRLLAYQVKYVLRSAVPPLARAAASAA